MGIGSTERSLSENLSARPRNSLTWRFRHYAAAAGRLDRTRKCDPEEAGTTAGAR